MSALPLPAVVPAAGESRRMGRPKMLLEIDGEPLIARVVAALRGGGAEPVIVVAPPAATPEGPPVAAAARQAGAVVVVPADRPAEMRASVELGVQHLGPENPPPGIVLTPGDHPGITSAIVRQVLNHWAGHPGSIIVPRVEGRAAHPTVLPWDVVRMIASLPPHQGINALVAAHPDRVAFLELPHRALADDLNTPDDLERWQNRERSTVTVRLFAVAKERAGRAEIEVVLPLPATVAALRQAIAARYPSLAELAPRVMIAVETDYASDESMISPGSRIALIPPVSGG